jgi:hypothetical protein
VGQGGGGRPSLGGAGGDAGGVDGLPQPSTYLGGTGGCQHHHSGHLQHLVRAGQLPRPPAGRGLAVPGQGPGWLLQLTQVGALCIPWPVFLRHACHYHWGGSGGAAQSMLVSNLHLGVRDLPRSRSWRRGRAGHLQGLQHSPALSALGLSGVIGLQGDDQDCPGLHTCTPNTLGSYVCRTAHDKRQKSMSAGMVPEHWSRPCATQQGTAAQVSGRVVPSGWSLTLACQAGTLLSCSRIAGPRNARWSGAGPGAGLVTSEHGATATCRGASQTEMISAQTCMP